ncbi:hypothetical protein NC653_036637 [Populus alba x Populus x berolinensis]|uniref:Uncharacterized protein n=1 Tax=Populus alba x Populus x berolinensis TaxID=444605 RepID=A0AAD6LKD3_9ROSI|nr:hypothetical protein NC653_036637 [Populus alba x Populus x berolinensis]
MRPPLTQVLLFTIVLCSIYIDRSVIRERPSTKRAIYIWWVFVMSIFASFKAISNSNLVCSCDLLSTVLWHLPLDFLVRFLLLSFTLFLQNFTCSLLNTLSLSQPLPCMQVLEHFVMFGAVAVSCSMSLWHVSNSALVCIFEVGLLFSLHVQVRSSPLYCFISMILIVVMNSPSGYLGFCCALIAATIKIVLLLVWGPYYHCCL